jgi:hypothetical protein
LHDSPEKSERDSRSAAKSGAILDDLKRLLRELPEAALRELAEALAAPDPHGTPHARPWKPLGAQVE